MKTATLWTLLVLAAFPALANATDYVIQLSRPYKPGERHQVDVSSIIKLKKTATVDAKEQPEENLTIEYKFSGTEQILAASADGTPTSIRYVIGTFTRTIDKVSENVIDPQGVLMVSVTEDGLDVDLEGQFLSREQMETIREVLDLKATRISEDAVFGTKERRKIGDSWSINAKAALQYAADAGVNAKLMVGTVKLTEAKAISGLPSLVVRGEMVADSFQPADEPPAGFKIVKSQMKANLAGIYPEDTRVKPLTEQIASSTEVVMEGQVDKKAIRATTVGTSVRTMKRAAIKQVAKATK